MDDHPYNEWGNEDHENLPSFKKEEKMNRDDWNVIGFVVGLVMGMVAMYLIQYGLH